MRMHRGMLLMGLLAVCLLGAGCGQPAGSGVPLPGPAAQALDKAYPGAKIRHVGLESEDGRQLYEVKLLKDGAMLEVTLTEDGTIVEVESPLPTEDLPKAVAEAVAKAAPGARMVKASRQELLADAKLNTLAPPLVCYEVEVEQGDRQGELTLAADGTVLEGVKWEKAASHEKGRTATADDDDDDDEGGRARSSTTQADQDFRAEFQVDKADLADSGENAYFILRPGYRLILQDGKDTLTITVLDETRIVDGVRTRVVEERETKGGQLAEVSRNFFAIHKKTRDVYYFGEDVDIYKDGKVAGHGGAWLSGENGAKFGLMMPGAPRIGQKFYQELAPKVAMDRCEILSLTEVMKTPAGEFKDVLCVRDSSALDNR